MDPITLHPALHAVLGGAVRALQDGMNLSHLLAHYFLPKQASQANPR